MLKLKNKYFLFRHGETIYQTKKKNFVYPWPETTPVKLTKKGEKQVKTAARKLKKEKIDLIFASDFFRTRQTAEIVAKELGLKIIFDKRLRDINLGVYQGGRKEKFYQDFQKYSKRRFYKRPLGGESWLDTRKRMIKFLKDTNRRYKGKKILIISHGDPLWLLEGAVKRLSNQEILDERYVKKNYIKVGELKQLSIK